MGRKPKSIEERKSREVSVCMSAEDYLRFKALSEIDGMTMSQWFLLLAKKRVAARKLADLDDLVDDADNQVLAYRDEILAREQRRREAGL